MTAPLDPRYFFTEAEAGPLLLTERLWPTGTAWAVLAGIPVLFGAVLLPQGAVTAVAVALGVLLALGAFALAGVLQQHRVHERALVTGVSWPGAEGYVVPFASVDPSRVRLHHRANLISRRLRRQGSRTLRTAPWSTVAVSLPGLAPVWALPSARAKAQQLLALERPGAVLFEPVDSLQPAAPAYNLPLDTWVIGTRRPEALLRAIEQGLLAAGRADARGLADRELASPVVERWRRPLTDADIY